MGGYQVDISAWDVVVVLTSTIGVLTGLIGLVSRTFRGYRAPVAGAIVTICGVVMVICVFGFAETVGWSSPSSLWGFITTGLPWVLITMGLFMAFLGNRPPDRQPLRSLPGTCGESTPQGRPCALHPGHEGSHRYVASTRHHPPSKERATAPSS